ncbi:MAG: hypothetical protein R2710_30570 [Acidimicrobiales bacterium]
MTDHGASPARLIQLRKAVAGLRTRHERAVQSAVQWLVQSVVQHGGAYARPDDRSLTDGGRPLVRLVPVGGSFDRLFVVGCGWADQTSSDLEHHRRCCYDLGGLAG